jgi:hypothetical protein
MQSGRGVEVEPDLFLANSIVRFGRIRQGVPSREALIIQVGSIARDNDTTRKFLERFKQPQVVAFSVVVLVDARAPSSGRKIRRVTIHQFVAGETLGSEEVDGVGFYIRG